MMPRAEQKSCCTASRNLSPIISVAARPKLPKCRTVEEAMKERVWEDVFFCWAWLDSCRIDSNLLEAYGSWVSGVGALLLLFHAYRSQREAKRRVDQAELAAQRAAVSHVVAEVAGNLRIAQMVLHKVAEIADTTAAFKLIGDTLGMFQLSAWEASKDSHQYLPEPARSLLPLAASAIRETMDYWNHVRGKWGPREFKAIHDGLGTIAELLSRAVESLRTTYPVVS